MIGRLGNTLFGIALYTLGAIVANIFFEPVISTLNPMMELPVVALSVFFLSALFYGRFGYPSMLFAGFILGSSFAVQPLYSVFALAPCLISLIGGTELGKAALMDIRGSRNLFDGIERHILKAALALVLAVGIAYLFGGIGTESILAHFGIGNLDEFLQRQGGF